MGKALLGTDRLFGLRERVATCRHEFDQLCADLGIEHRLAPPQHPHTNGRVERLNGRIEEVLPLLPCRRGTRNHAAPLRAALQSAAFAISLGQQDALAGDEGLAQNKAGVLQETALLPFGM
ncbi:MAG: DDE-type integrase/transposase/recombinase [Candidatus Saccharibacteria bacterium]|nr:DDE-type integrase/transposase/recombinase [Pseudorhodobacter sp.]